MLKHLLELHASITRGPFRKQTHPSTDRRRVSERAAEACFPRTARQRVRQDIPCVQREPSRDPAGGISAGYAQQVSRLSGFSPPRFNLVLAGCRHPRAVPLACRVSARFYGLAHMSVPTCPASPPCTDGPRVRVAPGWVACPPTRPTGHTLGIPCGERNRESRGDTRHPRPGTSTPLHTNPSPLKRPSKLVSL